MEIVKIQKAKFTKEDQTAIQQVLAMLDKISAEFQDDEIAQKACTLYNELSDLTDEVDVDAELF